MKKARELRELSLEELENLEREKAEDLMHMRIKLRMRQIDNALTVRNTRREVAKIKTVINEKRRSR